MITEDYVSFDVAKLLKEKGFEQYKCQHSYDSKGVFKWSDNLDPYEYSVPTHQMVMKWLREKHIIIVVQPEYFNAGEECSYWGVDMWVGDNYEKLQGDFPSYEEAVEAALKYCLENLI